MSADPAAPESLTKTLRRSIYGNAEAVDPEEREWLPREVAARLLESDWLAARDAAMRAEGTAVLADQLDARAARYQAAARSAGNRADPAAVEALGRLLMRDHGCILHNGQNPEARPCRACTRRVRLVVDEWLPDLLAARDAAMRAEGAAALADQLRKER